MKRKTNYVIGGGPVALIASETLALAGEKVVMIFPHTNKIIKHSVRDSKRVEFCKEDLGLYGGTARIWDFQCTRLSRMAFLSNPVAKKISYLEYLSSSKYVEEKLGISSWPKIKESLTWTSKDSSAQIQTCFSVIAKKRNWDTYFFDIDKSGNIQTLDNFVEEIDLASGVKIRLDSGREVVLEEQDVLYLAAGTIGILDIIKASTDLKEIPLNALLDHPSFEIGRVKGIIPDHLRKPFLNDNLGNLLKKKYLVRIEKELGIFEFREKWPAGFLTKLKRISNLVLRIFHICPLFRPDLWVWIQMSQTQIRSQRIEGRFGGDWKVLDEDVMNLNTSIQILQNFMESLGLELLLEYSITNPSDFVENSKEAFHPSGILELDEQDLLTQARIFPLGACILGNTSWNNPTLIAMATTRAIILQQLKDGIIKPE